MNRRIIVPAFLVILLLAGAASQAQLTPRPATAPPVSIPFELVTRHVVVKVRINNSRPLSFVFDTGDKVAIVDLARAQELGLDLHGQVQVGGAGSGRLNGSQVRGATWTLPGLEGFSQPVALAFPLDRLASRFGHDFDGIIGSDFIKQFVVEIDYQAGVLRFHDKNTFAYSGAGETIPIDLDSQGHPILEAEIKPLGSEPIKGKFVLDIGSGGSLALHSPFVADHGLLNANLKTIRAIGAGGAGGQTVGRVGRISDLRIGKFKIENPTVLFSEDKAGAFASRALAGNIGQQVASKFKVFLDYAHKRIILEPVSTFGDPFERAHSGMALVAEGKNYNIVRITEVLENSPASEVGLQKDDLLLTVNDKPAAELTITKLHEMFEKPAAYKITVQRGDQTLKVTLKTRKLV
jgi:Aspartyl protease/PDZ domain